MADRDFTNSEIGLNIARRSRVAFVEGWRSRFVSEPQARRESRRAFL